MLGNAATLKIAIEVDDKGTVKIRQLGKASQDAGGQADQSFRKAGRSLGDFDSTASRTLGSIQAKIVGLAAGFVSLLAVIRSLWTAAKDAARFETMGIVMENVGANAGYSAKEMAGFEKNLRKAGIAMTESRSVLAMMAQAELDLAKSTDLARIAQDAAVIGNINSSEAFERMVTGIRSGQVEILRTIGINVTFEEGYKRLAAQLGKNAKDLTDQEKMQSRMNQVLEYGVRIQGTYERSMETAGKQLLSFTRYLGDLSVLVGHFTLDTLAMAVFGAADKVKGLNERLIELQENGTLAEWSKRIAENIRIAADAAVHLGKILIAGGVLHTALIYGPVLWKGLQAAILAARLELEIFLLTAKTGGVWAVLTANIGGATTAVLSLKTATMGLMALFAGWEIGKWLYDNFETARLAGLALVDGLTKGWIYVEHGAKVAWENISYAWSAMISSLKREFAGWLETYALGLQKLPGMGKIGAALEEYARGIDTGRAKTEEHRKTLAALAADLEKNIATHDAIIEELRIEAVNYNKVAEEAKKTGAVQVQAAEDTVKVLGELDKAIADTGRSYNVQVAAYMAGTDELTRNILDRRDQLEADERERMARVSTAVEEFYGDIYDQHDQAATSADEMAEYMERRWEEAHNGMQRVIADWIYDWKISLDSILDLFKRMLAEMLAAWAMHIGKMAIKDLFGIGGGGSLASLTSGGGLLDKVLGGGSLAKSVASAGKWVAGLLGIGGSAAAPALLGGGSVGVAAYPAVGVATSGTGYAVGMGGMGAAGATPTAAGATTTGGGSMALGLAPWMAPAAVGAIGLGLWAKFVFGDKKPTTTELMNQMALTPEDYAFAIGTAFTEAMDPVYGILQNHMMNAQGTALTTWNQFETEFRDVQTRIYDHTTGQWQDLAYSGQVLFAMMRGDVVSEMDAMAMEVETGIAGLAEQLIAASEQMQTGLDKARGAMQDMGVSGGYLKRAMDLASRSLESAGHSTDALRDYLEGLGLSTDDVSTVLELLQADLDKTAAGVNSASASINKLAGTIGDLVYAANEQIAIPSPPAVQPEQGGGRAIDDIVDLFGAAGKGSGGSLGGYMTNALSLVALGGKGSSPMDPKVKSTYISGPPWSTVRSGDPAVIGPFMQDILFKMAQLGRTGLDKELAALNFEMRRVTKQAREMGASEKDLYDIERYYKQLRDAAAAEYQRKEEERARKLTEHIGTIDEQLAALTMSDKDKAIAATVRQMEAAIEKAVELGASEADLAKIRELQLKQEEEIRTRGLRDAIEEMRRFRESLADTADTAGRSAQAQRQLMEILAQAREGDFSGVEAIGDVLRDISINKADYATAADYARAYWSVMHAVADIEKLASAKVPGFADGGDFTGGWRVVGERGPELEYTGPSRIYNRAQAGELINIDDLVVEVRELRREVSAGNYQVAKNTGKTARHVERWEAIGMPQERVA